MKATLEYELPEESHEHKCAVFSGDLYWALSTINERIRTHMKHGNGAMKVEELRELAWEALRLIES